MRSSPSTNRIGFSTTRLIGRTAPVLVLATLSATAWAADGFASGVHAVEQPPPPILERIAVEEGLSAVTLSVDGARAAAAYVVAKNEHKNLSTIRVYEPGSDAPQSHEMSGEIRDLLFSPDGEALLALQHISAKRRPGDVYLVRLDLETRKSRRELRLPPSAQGLAYRSTEGAILIACADEIRSVLLPDMRSGPLYRLLGVNASLATLDGTRVLVGRDDGIAVVDLTDPQGEDEMPVRLRIDSMDPVRQVAVSGDGTRVLARLAAAGVVSVRLGSPASFEAAEAGRGLLPSRPWPRGEPSYRAVATEAPPDEAVVAAPEPEPAAAPSAVPPADHDEPDPVAADTVPASAQLAGAIKGPAAAEVSSVVILGPDNILQEAQRVQPGENGRWHTAGLGPGRYRIQLAASNGRVLVVDPAFRVVQVESGQTTLDVDFRVLESP